LTGNKNVLLPAILYKNGPVIADYGNVYVRFMQDVLAIIQIGY